jgi:hypothetical protein
MGLPKGALVVDPSEGVARVFTIEVTLGEAKIFTCEKVMKIRKL